MLPSGNMKKDNMQKNNNPLLHRALVCQNDSTCVSCEAGGGEKYNVAEF